jgi:hypothetical protein
MTHLDRSKVLASNHCCQQVVVASSIDSIAIIQYNSIFRGTASNANPLPLAAVGNVCGMQLFLFWHFPFVAMPRSWHYVYLYLHAMIIFYFNRILLHQ